MDQQRNYTLGIVQRDSKEDEFSGGKAFLGGSRTILAPSLLVKNFIGGLTATSSC